MSVAISIRLPDKIVNELDNLADSIDRSRTYMIRKAVESYLKEYSDYLIALERLRNKDDKIISSKEMREQLGL
ncbi:MAG TPA: ribbon-helix-helix protein, CopG family [Thermoplasmatales archaeon]|nr:ribbon-helix-helix protein, CopG family [Thermoplasmatales archaeon]